MRPNVWKRKRKATSDGPKLDYTNLRNTFKLIDKQFKFKTRTPTSVPVCVRLETQIRRAQEKFKV